MQNIIELAVKLELSQAFLNKVASHPEATVKNVVEITKGCLYYIIDAPKELHNQITDYGFMTHIKNPAFQRYYNGEPEFVKIGEQYVAEREERDIEIDNKNMSLICNANIDKAKRLELELTQKDKDIYQLNKKVEGLEHLLRFTTNWPLHDLLGQLVKATDILLIDKSWDGHYHEEMRICSQIAKQIIADVNQFILTGKGLDLIYRKHQKLKNALQLNSTQLIGRVKERHKELEENYNFEYKPFYHGWLEGRVDLLQILKQTEDK